MLLTMGNGAIVAILGMSLMAAGCEGTSSGSCPNVAGCGGDVVGTWTIDNACLGGFGRVPAADGLQGFCQQAAIDSSGLRLAGTITYDANGTYAEDAKLIGRLSFDLPPACLTRQGAALTCQQLSGASAQVSTTASIDTGAAGTGARAPSSSASISCAANFDGGCACSTSIEQDVSVNGLYTTQGSMLTQLGGASAEYCVQGDTLYLRSPMQMLMSTGSSASASDGTTTSRAMAPMSADTRAVLIRRK